MTDKNSSELQTFLLSTLNMVYSGLSNQTSDIQNEFANLLKEQKISSDESAFFRAIFDDAENVPNAPTSIKEKLNTYPNLTALINNRINDQ